MLSPIANSPKPHEKKSCDKRLSSKTTYAALESGNGSIDGGGDHADEDDEQDVVMLSAALLLLPEAMVMILTMRRFHVAVDICWWCSQR